MGGRRGDISTDRAVALVERKMRIGVVACEIFKQEIEVLTEGDEEIVHKEYLEFALHVNAEEMRQAVMDKVNALAGKVDAVFIGYATCQKLGGLPKDVDLPAEMLEGDDCISVLIGPVEYAREKEICAGTWFSSPGWAEQGMAAVIKELHLDSMVDQGYDPMYFVDMIFDSYRRCLYIDTGVGDREGLEARSRDFAAQIKVPHHSREGNLERLAEGLRKTKAKAAAARTG
ncbi:MAG: DUF1638 domain-containing protein [Methanomassiliicoccus sp.]|nr:DUF1638 domain-containing protein [Methanomassiliicoccus sp.]